MDLKAAIGELISSEGPFIWASGDITGIRDEFELGKEQDLSEFHSAISMAYPLPPDALYGIKDRPTILYKHLYRQVNIILDMTALNVAGLISQNRGKAIAIPASVLIDWQALLAHVNHRQVAVHLGLGWYGRNNLLVTRDYGAQVRLVTILHDQPLEVKGPESDRALGCGRCRACGPVCPVGAIHNGPEDFDKQVCFEKVRQFEKIQGVGQRICGVCIKACKGPPKK